VVYLNLNFFVEEGRGLNLEICGHIFRKKVISEKITRAQNRIHKSLISNAINYRSHTESYGNMHIIVFIK